MFADNRIVLWLAAALFYVLWLLSLYRRFLPATSNYLIWISTGLVMAVSYFLPLIGFLMLGALGALEITLRFSRKGNSPSYAPASARFEGGGIKRGLTGPEAAVLLGKPLHVILALALVDMLHKGLLLLGTGAALQVSPVETMRTRQRSLNPEIRSEMRRKAAQTLGKTLHPFEEPILELLEQQAGAPIGGIDFGLAVLPLVDHVARRVGGYDLAETREYYQQIIKRAPVEARSEGVLQKAREKIFARNLAWILLDENYAGILDQQDYSYAPMWLADAELPGAPSLAGWFAELVEALERSVNADDLSPRLGKSLDTVSAKLMTDIAQATYYG
ncbi:MAG: hypothetical protein HYZ26_10510 [Chloroflexi bacterium]|nr:hypothetical protein [Chloroflexota bacterium]